MSDHESSSEASLSSDDDSSALRGGKRRKHSWGPRGKVASQKRRCLPTVSEQTQQQGSAQATRSCQNSSTLLKSPQRVTGFHKIEQSQCLGASSAAHKLAALLGHVGSIDSKEPAHPRPRNLSKGSEASLVSLQRGAAGTSQALPAAPLQKCASVDYEAWTDYDLVACKVSRPLIRGEVDNETSSVPSVRQLKHDEMHFQTGGDETLAFQLRKHEERKRIRIMMESDLQADESKALEGFSSETLHQGQKREQLGSDWRLASRLQQNEDHEAMKHMMDLDLETLEIAPSQGLSGTQNDALCETLEVANAKTTTDSKHKLQVQLKKEARRTKQVLSDEALALQLQRLEEAAAEKRRQRPTQTPPIKTWHRRLGRLSSALSRTLQRRRAQ